MAATVYGILTNLLNGRNALNLKTSEAKKLVREFYLEVECATIGTTNKKKVDSISRDALSSVGLEFFA